MEQVTSLGPISSRTFVNLPDEVLVKILKLLLSHHLDQIRHKTCESMIPMFDACKEWFGEESYLLIWPQLPKRERLQAQVLRVCWRFHEIGNPILYSGTLMFMSIMDCRLCQGRINAQKEYLSLLRRPRRHRLRKLVLLIPTHLNYGGPHNRGDGAVLIGECMSLNRHQQRWDKILFYMMDQPDPPTHLSRERYGLLTRGLGHLHGKDIDGKGLSKQSAEDAIWAMQQPVPTYPLWTYHNKLTNHLLKYDSGVEYDNGRQSLRDFFIDQSKESADSRNSGQFYINMKLAIDYIEMVVSQGLVKTPRSFKGSEEQGVRTLGGNILDEVRRKAKGIRSLRYIRNDYVTKTYIEDPRANKDCTCRGHSTEA